MTVDAVITRVAELARDHAPAAVIAVGTELTSGLHVDTNGPEVARELESAGLRVDLISSVPDDEHAIASALASALTRHALIVVTGGLGPTHDDVTRDAAARALDLTLQADPEIAGALRQVTSRHRESGATAQVLRQAEVLSGATVLTPELGTAPGQVVAAGDALVVLLPGPPREMRPMLRTLLTAAERHESVRTLRTAGLTETDVQLRVQRALSGTSGIELTVLATPALVDVVLRDRGASPDGLEHAATAVRAALGTAWYGDGEVTLAEAVLRIAGAAGMTIAVAESCTGGSVAAALTDVPGASAVFLGGAVTYADDAKSSLLGVDPALLATRGAVSAPAAEAMATGVRKRLGADIAAAITGIAGPGGGSADKPVGTVWFAVASADSTTSEVRHFFGDRHGVRTRATVTALDLLRQALVRRMDPTGGGDGA